MAALRGSFGLLRIGVWSESPREDRTRNKNEVNYDDNTIDGVPLRKLYIKNVPCGTKQEQLYSCFMYFGDVENIVICHSQHTCKGFNNRHKECDKVTFAFVTYKSTDDAIKALNSKSVQFKRNKLYILAAFAHCQPYTQDESSEEDEPLDPNTSVSNGSPLIDYKSNFEAPIENLDDYCLRSIFSLLPHMERIKIERVCRRWKTIARGMWHTEQELDVANNIPFAIPEKHRTFAVLRKIFKRCGPSLKKLNLQNVKIKGSDGLIEAIVRKCLHLEELHLDEQYLSKYKTNMLKPLKHLRVLSLRDCRAVQDANLQSLLEDKSHLTHVEVTHSCTVDGSFLSGINSPLETLNLNSCEELTSDNLRANLGKFSSTLKQLHLADCQLLDMDDINIILSQLPELHTLTLSHYPQESLTALDGITTLKRLKSLHVAFNRSISEDFLQLLIQSNLELTHLDISGAGQGYELDEGTSFCFSRLNTMKSLRILNLSYIPNLNRNIIHNYASRSPPIESLSFCFCNNLKDDDIKSLFTECHQLKYLDLRGCSHITQETIKTANEALALRSNNQPLQIVVGGTGVKGLSQGTRSNILNNSGSEWSDETDSSSCGSEAEAKLPPLHPLLTISYESNSTAKPYLEGAWFGDWSEDNFIHQHALDNLLHNFIDDGELYEFDIDSGESFPNDSDEDYNDLDDEFGFF
ncbi:unnamed protein product [Bemisia tabaci]|uniref:RNA-binding protein EEED8.10 n=1 Tax=Bemisia tabaci TaxID=7038 RepID=A0A9P0G2D5_BEMTA|nr:unnamed protein product [Bemisia tabaci]